ncbi:hypothetical protein TWF696_008665 [Orbilia brochopaga]|uniref:RBR-type E3 ubiquitin transferase n=1 Tax=Orbilia brochopaga TaxID=3140254 RepID=A0AAV9UK97_9PEZI
MMEVIQPPASTASAVAKQRAQRQRLSQASLLISSSTASSAFPVSASPSSSSASSSCSHHSPSPFRYSCSSSSLSCSSVFANSSPFFLTDEVEGLNRSNSSSPEDLSAYVCTAPVAAGYRRSQYRAASSRPLSCYSPVSRCAATAAVSGDTAAGVSGTRSRSGSCATRTARPATLSAYNSRPATSSTTTSTASSATNFNITASSSSRKNRSNTSCRFLPEDTDSGSGWYNPLLSERFRLTYVDESPEYFDSDDDDTESCDSSDTELPGDGKPLFIAIQESILYFNTTAGIPLPEFVERRIHHRGSLVPAPPATNSQTFEPPAGLSTARQSQLSDSPRSHVKKPSLVSLDITWEHIAPILEQDSDSERDSDSLYNSSGPIDSPGSSLTSASIFTSKEAAEAYARNTIDLELEAALKESTRIEEERKAREAEEDAAYLRALHESIIAEKEAQAKREDIDFLDRLFSKDRPLSVVSTCSTDSYISLDSGRNSTAVTALSPPPPKTLIKVCPPANTSDEMPSNQEDASTSLSHSSKERPISAVRDRKAKAKLSVGDIDDPTIRPTLHRAHTSTSGGFKRLLGLSGRSTHADNSEDDKHSTKSSRSSKKGSEKPPMDRRSSEPNAANISHRHRHHRHTDEADREREGSHHRSHRHHHHRHSEASSPSKESREKRRSRDKPKTPDDTSKKSQERGPDIVVDAAPAAEPAPAEPPVAEAVPTPAAEAPVANKEKPAEERKKRRKKHASLGDILRVSRKLKAGAEPAAPAEPPKMVECITCLSDDIPETEAAQLECGHAFCNDCLIRLFDLSLTDPAHMPPRCCQPTQHIPLHHVDKLLSTKTKILWNKKYQEFTTTNRRYCPATDCGEWIRPKDFTTVEGVEIGTCPRCKLKVCALCGLKEHGTEECPKDEFLNQVRELGKELGWQRCYSCRAMVELERGCNHMTCRCTAEFCMICGAKWKTCECPWFNFPPEEDDAPAPRLDGSGHLVDDLAWGWDRRTDEDERAARQLAADFAELDANERNPHARSAWAPMFSGVIGEGVLRLLSRTRHLEGAALDRLRSAYAAAFDDDFVFGDSSDESEDDEVAELPSQAVKGRADFARPTLRVSQSDMTERRRKRDSTYNLDWSPQGSTEDLHEGVDFGFLPQLTRSFLPRMFGGHHHHHHGDGEFGRPVRAFTEDMGRYGDLLEGGDFNRMRREFDNVRWGGVGAA